jgi:acetyl esterase/lipase
VFGTGGGRDLHCDVFVPPDAPARARGLLLVHGGAWVVGDKSQLRGYGFLLGREGTVCVASEYRLAKESQWPAQIHDVKAAIRWMRANADELGIDPERIAVCGASSGAHLALMAAGTADVPELEGDGGNSGTSSQVAAAVSFYGPTRLEPGGEMLKDSVAQLLGSDPGANVFEQASPAAHVSADYPPTMLMHSNQDELVPREQSITFAETLNALGVPVELHLFDNVPHMFDGSKRLGRQAALMVDSFLQRYLPDADSEA